MLLFFLSSLLFLSNSLTLDKLPARETVADDVIMGADDVTMNIQMVMKNQTGNSKSLIASLEKLDPATIASAVVLIKQLLSSTAADLLASQQAFDLQNSRLTKVLKLIDGLKEVPKNGLYSWFKPSSANAAWSSSIGKWEGVASGTVVPTVVTKKGNGASVPITYLTGTINSLYNFGRIVPATFTICSMSRYLATNSGGRILQAKGSNWFHGHHNGKAGMNYYGGWNANGNGVSPKTDWLIMCGSSAIGQAIYVNGVALSDKVRKGAASPKGDNLWINPKGDDWEGETSDWAVAEIITWNRVLTVKEIVYVSAHMRKELSG